MLNKITEKLWQVLAFLLVNTGLWRTLDQLAQKTPYSHIEKNGVMYMYRYWLFNAYDRPGYNPFFKAWRIHHIKQEDRDRHLHDHPCQSRTIILSGGYDEEIMQPDGSTQLYRRRAGYTGEIPLGRYHRIVHVLPNTVTLFITDKRTADWGYWVDGKKVPFNEYHNAGELVNPQVIRGAVHYSIDGFREGLSRDLAELRDLVAELIETGDCDKAELCDYVNSLICSSNGFNCVSCKAVEGFSNLSNIEIKQLETRWERGSIRLVRA